MRNSRHTWASHMLASGADLAYVSNQLGHANPSITLRIYSHSVPGMRRVTTGVLDNKKMQAICRWRLPGRNLKVSDCRKLLILVVELTRIELVTS
ncbi:MAG: tyrosine-type recombinase/integrase [Acidobacteria bacterium]|nr:tyrosine-type recombinase/integrase [Acidobacteriota bacterium]